MGIKWHRQGPDPKSSRALKVHVKHAHSVSENTRLDTWSGPGLPILFHPQGSLIVVKKPIHILKKLNVGELMVECVRIFSFTSFKVSKIRTHFSMKVLHHSTSKESSCAFPCSLPSLPKVCCNSMQWRLYFGVPNEIWDQSHR